MYRFICLMRFDIAKDFVYMVLGRYANRCLSGYVCYTIVTLDDTLFLVFVGSVVGIHDWHSCKLCLWTS